MDLQLNEDQLAVEGAINKLAEDFATSPVDFHGFALVSDELDKELEEGGYFEIACVPEMGPLSAAVSTARLAQLPYTAEVALSMLVRPHLDIELPRPFGVIENGRPGRFVPQAKTLIIIDGDNVGIAHPQAGDVVALPDSLFAYPMGKLVGTPEIKALDADTAKAVKTWMRVALAAEVAGLMQAALDATVEHVSVRKQFGRPLGTFQALRHRLAECAVLTGGVRWLALRAADSANAGDAALAALHAQDSATRLIYDMHQMSGAMGMTLEMDLHLWTYRMKALLSELGGRGGQAQVVADECFADA